MKIKDLQDTLSENSQIKELANDIGGSFVELPTQSVIIDDFLNFFQEKFTSEKVERFIKDTNLSALDILSATQSHLCMNENKLLENKFILTELLSNFVTKEEKKLIEKISDITYANLKQLDSMAETFSPIIVLKSLIREGVEGRHKITEVPCVYIKNELNKLTNQQYLELFHEFIVSCIDYQSPLESSNRELIAESLLAYKKLDISEYLILSPNNILAKQEAYSACVINKEKINKYKEEICKICDSKDFEKYIQKIFSFLGNYSPEMLYLYPDVMQPSYLNNHVVVRWYHEKASGQEKLAALANFVHEITHYALDKIFHNRSNPYEENVGDNYDAFAKAGKEVFVSVMQLLNEKVPDIKISSENMQSLIDKENYSEMIDIIQNNEKYKNLFLAFQLIYWNKLFEIFPDIFMPEEFKENIIEACSIFSGTEQVDHTKIKEQAILITQKQIMSKLKNDDREVISTISALVDKDLYDSEERDTELIARLPESIISCGKISDIMLPLGKYWIDHIGQLGADNTSLLGYFEEQGN